MAQHPTPEEARMFPYLSRIFVVIAVLCFLIALLLTAGTVHGSNPSAWGYAGLAFLATSFLL